MEVGDRAFLNCEILETINLPADLRIERDIFKDCYKLNTENISNRCGNYNCIQPFKYLSSALSQLITLNHLSIYSFRLF